MDCTDQPDDFDLAPRVARIWTIVGPELAPISYQRNGWAVTPRLRGTDDPIPGEYVLTCLRTGIATGGGGFPINHDTAINICRALGDAFPDAYAGVAFGDLRAAWAHPDNEPTNAIAHRLAGLSRQAAE